jgi:hypothetical protein
LYYLNWHGGVCIIPSDFTRVSLSHHRVYIEKALHMLEVFPQKPLAEVVERGILDPKTRELILVGMLVAMGRTGD